MAELRGVFDLIYDQIETLLTDYATAQAAIDPSYGFTVHKDRFTPLANQAGAHALIYMGEILPDEQRSSPRKLHEIEILYYVDMVVQAKGIQGVTSYEQAEKVAATRVRYLIQQCLKALFAPTVIDLGLPIGTISKQPVPRIEFLEPDTVAAEKPAIGYRMTFNVSTVWDPGVVTGPALDQLHVDAARFSALYDFGG